MEETIKRVTSQDTELQEKLRKVWQRFYYGSVKEFNLQDHFHQWALRLVAFSVFFLLLFIVILLVYTSLPAIHEFGLGFITDASWDPIEEEFGALAFIYGTVVTSVIALMLAAPFSLGAALFTTELCPRTLRPFVSFLIEMLAAIPSIVYGLWALFVLAPFIREDLTPFFKNFLGVLPLFQGPSFGIGIMNAAIVLAIMITPTITAVSTEVFKTVPQHQKEAALALGATRWETIHMAVFRPGFTGILGAIILGLGRALGETMAVAMVIGNRAEISASLFAPASTMASVIANEYAEATDSLHLASLTYVALILFGVSFIMNFFARFFVWRVTRVSSGSAGVR